MSNIEQHQRGPLTTIEWTSGDGSPAERLVVLCHGFGAPGDDLVGIGEAFGNGGPATRWVFPAALLAPEDMADWAGRAWWPLRLADMVAAMESQGIEATIEQVADQVPPGIEDARAALIACVNEARSGLETLPWVLGGFSQGAMLTSDVAARGLLQPNGLVLFSGCPTASSDWDALDPIGRPTVVSHGTADMVLPFLAGELLRDRLRDHLNCDVTFVPHDGGHQIPPVALQAANQLLRHIME